MQARQEVLKEKRQGCPMEYYHESESVCMFMSWLP